MEVKMDKIIDYKIMSERSLEDLEKRVTKWLPEWQPYKEIVQIYKQLFIQVVVKYE